MQNTRINIVESTLTKYELTFEEVVHAIRYLNIKCAAIDMKAVDEIKRIDKLQKELGIALETQYNIEEFDINREAIHQKIMEDLVEKLCIDTKLENSKFSQEQKEYISILDSHSYYLSR